MRADGINFLSGKREFTFPEDATFIPEKSEEIFRNSSTTVNFLSVFKISVTVTRLVVFFDNLDRNVDPLSFGEFGKCSFEIKLAIELRPAREL